MADEDVLPTPASPDAAGILAAAGADFRVHHHPPVRTAEDIRSLTGFSIERSVKVMVFTTDEQQVVLAAFPGQARLRYGQLAAALGVRRKALTPAGTDVLRRMGMEPGGVSPVCADPDVTVVLDSAVPGMGRVFCGSGRADHTLEVAAADLVRLARNPVIYGISALPEA